MGFKRVKVVLRTLSILAMTNSSLVYASEKTNIFALSLEELLNIKISTVSRWEQSLDESPAFVEIVTQDDIQRRGYKDLSFLLDDIGGIQVTRTFGDNYFNTLWRGVRHTIGSSHLILIDGIKYNHLYNNESEIMAAFPLSNIKHIEIVYGPASVAYGNDAVVGIINIITYKDGERSNGFVQIGENNTQIIDFTHLSTWRDYHYRVSGRYDKGDLDMSNATNNRWTDPALLSDTDIWGSFALTHGQTESRHDNKAFEFSLFDSKTEITLQYLELGTGYGLQYTFDHSLPDAGLWYESEFSAHWKQQYEVNNDLLIKTMFRYRNSNIDDDSFFIEGYLDTNPITGNPQRLIDASYWESRNKSLTGSIEMNWQMNEDLTLLAGIDYESKNLQKAYNINFGLALPPELIDSNYVLPIPPERDSFANNRIDTNQKGLYLLSQYQLNRASDKLKQTLHFGIRSDKHSVFGTETTVRTGYVGQWDKTTFKLFYGEAYQEPSARLLYGGWQGSGSDPDLQPRNAETIELNMNYQLKEVLLSGNYFRMLSENLFNTTDTGALNVGKGLVTGGDLRIKYQPKIEYLANLSFWATLSWLDSTEQDFNQAGELSWGPVGDLADYTLHGGAYITFNDHWQLNLRGRYYDDRKTIATNELEEVASFINLDANIIYQMPAIKQLKLAFDITNILDKDYFHPGVRSAAASTTNVGQVDENGVWIGSGSFYNSQIPQPGREFRLSFYWSLN